jgi:hypothetical protein
LFKSRKLKKITFMKYALLFLSRTIIQRGAGEGRILLGDKKGGSEVTLLPKKFQCVGVWISTGSNVYTHTHTHTHTYIYIWLNEHSVPVCVKLELPCILRNLDHIYRKAGSVCLKQMSKLLFRCNDSWTSVWKTCTRGNDVSETVRSMLKSYA